MTTFTAATYAAALGLTEADAQARYGYNAEAACMWIREDAAAGAVTLLMADAEDATTVRLYVGAGAFEVNVQAEVVIDLIAADALARRGEG